MHGPKLPFSEELHATKYRGKGESFRDAMNRVAGALKDNNDHFEAFRDALLNMRFMPAGRIQAGVGSTKKTTPWNCFVSGTINDSFVDGYGSIMQRATEAAATMRQGGGVGYDFSELRPRGNLIKKLESRSSGPVSFMEIYDAVCKCIASSGHRRGAQMGVLRVDHPDIEEFVHAKQNQHRLTGFNVSVAVTDEFMRCLATGKPFELKWGGEVYKEVDAANLWDVIMRSTWDWAEPGVLFVDTINQMNNLWYCERIAATNPCGEQPLPPNGACLLGSFNLVKYLWRDGSDWHFGFNELRADIPHVVRAMDNIIDRGLYPLPAQAQEGKNKRRMGLGITGLANALEALRMPYGSRPFVEFQGRILEILRDETYAASVQLAREKGAFELFDADLYTQGKFIKTLPIELQRDIAEYGIRNSHLTSIAPTGTISLCADNISSGIEPVFAYSFDRTVQAFEGPSVERVTDYGVRELGIHGKTAAKVTVAEHLAVLTEASLNVDSAVSKTCNVDGSVAWDDFKNIYVQAWQNGCKGCTTFRTDGKRGGILTTSEEDTTGDKPDVEAKPKPDSDDGAACYIDPVTGRHECE